MFFSANAVWPALYFEGSLLQWWVVAGGLVMELPFYYWIQGKEIKKSLHALIVCNLISTLLGIILIPVLGIAWEIFPGILMFKIWNIGTFNPITYTATFLLAIFANVLSETTALKLIYKTEITKKTILFLTVANFLSVSLALAHAVSKYGKQM